jgi:hypothetical protein
MFKCPISPTLTTRAGAPECVCRRPQPREIRHRRLTCRGFSSEQSVRLEHERVRTPRAPRDVRYGQPMPIDISNSPSPWSC